MLRAAAAGRGASDRRSVSVFGSASSSPHVLAFDVHQHEARRVPQLVAEIAIAFAAIEVEVERATERREDREREAQRVGAERRNPVRETACACAWRSTPPGAGPSGWPCAWRSASRASMPSMRSSGSSTLPFDFDIFWPSSSRTIALMYTSRNGISPVKYIVVMIIRATQKKMMSKPVTSTDDGQERSQLLRVGRPAERRMAPQRRREPGVEHVRIAA